MITGLDHVQIAMPAGGEDLARAFYGTLLGLTEVAKPEALAARGGCWFEGYNTHVHLGVDPEFKPVRKAHPAFTVINLAELGRSLRDAGYDVIPDNVVPGVERFFVADPFGNRLEFIQDGQGFSQRSD